MSKEGWSIFIEGKSNCGIKETGIKSKDERKIT